MDKNRYGWLSRGMVVFLIDRFAIFKWAKTVGFAPAALLVSLSGTSIIHGIRKDCHLAFVSVREKNQLYLSF